MIKVSRNDAGNCINFVGTTNPAYWNACLSAQINDDNPNNIDIVNDIRTLDAGEPVYEFYNVPYTDFGTKDGEAFADVNAAVDYITENANVTGNTGTFALGLTDTLDFKQDATTTSIIFSNGDAYGVNTIKALNSGDGLITIKQNTDEGRVLYTGLNHSNVTIDEVDVTGGLADVINKLNELFTVGPFEAVVIADPYSTMIADVGGTDTTFTLEGAAAVDPIGDDVFGNIGSGNTAGLKTVETIDQAGEYFTFDIRGEGIIGFGLVHTQASYDAGNFLGSSTYADPTTFAVNNSAHYGFQFSHWFHPTPNGSWTNYGANTSYSMREHWSTNWDKKADWLAGNNVKVKVGIDVNGFIEIATKNDDGTWGVHVRTSYPAAEGSVFHLGIKASNSSARVSSAPKVHLLEPAAPVMNFRYIESPDGVFAYPLFATEEEANYYDANHSGTTGSGTSHTHTYADDPTNTTWYMPDTGGEMAGSFAPAADAFMGTMVTYTEITSLTNADQTPPQFTQADMSREEGTAVNIQINPAGSTWSTTVDVSPVGSGLVWDGYSILQGTLTDVGADTDYTITVVRANSYGSSTGSFTLTATDVAPAQTSLTPFTKALDFSGSNEYAIPVNASQSNNPTRLTPSVQIAAPSAGQTVNNGRPWATTIVFRADGHSSNQHLWNQGEGNSTNNDNIYVRQTASGDMYFGWGREGVGYNECFIGNGFHTNNQNWFGLYIAHNGARFSGSNATAANLASAFDIRFMNYNSSNSQWELITGGLGDADGNRSTTNNWNAGNTGIRMDRSVDGYFSIGGRRGNRNWHGKVASMVRTTLLNGVALPDATEISMMITDPLTWKNTYKAGSNFRQPQSDSGVSAWDNANATSKGRATQIWLMGDGNNDSYANGIRNRINSADQNENKLQLNSMVSNDIQTVDIQGLT